MPYGPPGLTGQQRRTREPSRAGPRAGKRSARPGTPPPATSAPGRVWDPASTAAPPVPTGSQGAQVPPSRARRTPVPVRMQSWDGRAACLCDQEDAMPWPTIPRWAQRQAPMASPPGLEHQATLAPHAQGPAPAHTPACARAYTQDDGIFRSPALRWGLVAVDSPLGLGTGQSGSSASWWGREGSPHPRACSCMRPPAQPNQPPHCLGPNISVCCAAWRSFWGIMLAPLPLPPWGGW